MKLHSAHPGACETVKRAAADEIALINISARTFQAALISAIDFSCPSDADLSYSFQGFWPHKLQFSFSVLVDLPHPALSSQPASAYPSHPDSGQCPAFCTPSPCVPSSTVQYGVTSVMTVFADLSQHVPVKVKVRMLCLLLLHNAFYMS
jgi:hypothetical protein